MEEQFQGDRVKHATAPAEDGGKLVQGPEGLVHLTLPGQAVDISGPDRGIAADAAGLGELENGAIIFNTCAVTGEAVRQARQAIRKARRENPDARIIVTGCAAQTGADDFAAMDEVDLVLGNEEKLKSNSYRMLPDFGVNQFEKVRVNDIMEVRETASHMVDAIEGRARAFVEANYDWEVCLRPLDSILEKHAR